MSSNVIHEWYYQLKGKKLYLYKLLRGGYAPTNTGEFMRGRDRYIYPDEAIPTGLRIEYTAFVEPFVDKDPSALTEAGANPTLVEEGSPKESSHVNHGLKHKRRIKRLGRDSKKKMAMRD